ncbi:ABC transporter B family member 9-like [Gossypium hirsutum]|uniref:ABC transporter B family member 9-like n=1 Tax=Gossypium hirsutum TaxID=3635 RepID=A0A1U8JW13_GOSHI|nr:ABC transporter B family member 9-like [Gossypium hirsutum]
MKRDEAADKEEDKNKNNGSNKKKKKTSADDQKFNPVSLKQSQRLKTNVFIDGVDLRELQLQWIRGKIGLVSQEPIFFATTIRENIAYGKDNATNEEIRAAIEMANAAKFIDKLPDELDTMVGEHGTQLSGGQKKRIAIARAILTKITPKERRLCFQPLRLL